MNYKKFSINILVVLMATAALAGAAWDFSRRQVPIYQSSAKLLVIQELGDVYDPSSVNRSAEQVAKTLAAVVGTESFLDQVLGSGFKFPAELAKDRANRRQAWQQIISAESDGAFLRLQVFHSQPSLAENLAAASAYILITKTSQWHGSGESVKVMTVDPPLTSTRPVRPNVPLNTLTGAVTGLVLSSAWLYYRQLFTKDTPKKSPGRPTAQTHPRQPQDFANSDRDQLDNVGQEKKQALTTSFSLWGNQAIDEANIQLAELSELVYTQNMGLLKTQYSPGLNGQTKHWQLLANRQSLKTRAFAKSPHRQERYI